MNKLDKIFEGYEGKRPELDKETKEFIDNLDNFPVGKEYDYSKEK